MYGVYLWAAGLNSYEASVFTVNAVSVLIPFCVYFLKSMRLAPSSHGLLALPCSTVSAPGLFLFLMALAWAGGRKVVGGYTFNGSASSGPTPVRSVTPVFWPWFSPCEGLVVAARASPDTRVSADTAQTCVPAALARVCLGKPDRYYWR